MQTHDTASANNLHKTNCNIRNTICLISWLLKIFAIECNIENFNISSTKLLIRIFIIALFHAVLVSCSLYLKIQYIYESINVSIKYTDAVQTIYDFCQYVVDLYFVYKYGRNIVSEYYKQYDNIDKILDVTTYTTMRRKLMKMTGFFIFIWLISTTCDFFAWVLSYGWIIPLMYSIAYIYLLVKIMTTLDFSTHVMRIELRLQIIGDALQECYTKIECSPHFIGDLICNQNWLYKKSPSKILITQTNSKCLKILSNNDGITVQWLTRCYLMITEQVAFINAMYGVRILLNSLSLLIDMVRFTNIAVRVVMGSQHTVYNSGYFPAVSSLMRLLTCAALVISLVIHCEQAYSQRQRILNNIDHILVIKNPCKELTSALTELRTLVQNRPIAFNVANFFQLKNSILLSIASVVVTYTIILVQSIN